MPAHQAQDTAGNTPDTGSELLTFRIADKQFGIAMASIQEIVRIPRITRVPLSPGYVLGLMNLRGNIITVLNGAARLGRAPSPFTGQSRVLVLSIGDASLGFTVDAVDRILRVSSDQLEPLPGDEMGESGDLLSGVVKQDGRTILRISPDHLIEAVATASDQSAITTSRRPEQTAAPAAQVRRTVVVEIGREEFGINIGLVSEAVRFVQPNPVPDAPPFLAGLITLRSNVLPVIELRSLMQRPSLREETVRKTDQLRVEYSKARDAVDRPHACAAYLQKAHRMLESLGLRSAGILLHLMERNAELLRSLTSARSAVPSALQGQIDELADALEEIEETAGDDSDRRVLVIETADARFGLAVDRVTQVLDLPEASLQPPPPIAQQSGVHLSALARLENPPRLVLLLDLAEMITRNRLTSARTQNAPAPEDLMPAASQSAHQQWVSFITGDEEFGLPIADVVEIGRLETITRVPSAPDFIQGVINLRGEIVPVINLRKRFEFEAASTEQSRIIYIRSGAVKIGLIVDRVLEIVALPDAEPPPAAICSKRVAEYLDGIAKYGDRVILLLNSEKLLTKSEQEGVAAASRPGGSTKARPKKDS